MDCDLLSGSSSSKFTASHLNLWDFELQTAKCKALGWLQFAGPRWLVELSLNSQSSEDFGLFFRRCWTAPTHFLLWMQSLLQVWHYFHLFRAVLWIVRPSCKTLHDINNLSALCPMTNTRITSDWTCSFLELIDMDDSRYAGFEALNELILQYVRHMQSIQSTVLVNMQCTKKNLQLWLT